MNKDEIEDILIQSKKRFLENDQYLLSVDVNERSLTHKFAEYLQTIVGSSWNVDCEYNRFGSDSKRILSEIKELIDPYVEGVQTDDVKAKTVYPDIIIHKRGAIGPDLLVIEAKKDASTEDRRRDMEKLNKIQYEYGYYFAVFINFKTKNKEIEWEFVNSSDNDILEAIRDPYPEHTLKEEEKDRLRHKQEIEDGLIEDDSYEK